MDNKIKIIGISLVKNEDIYIAQSLANIIDFCDKIIVYDNGSTDDTIKIVNKYVDKYPYKIKLEYISNILESQILLNRFVSKDFWIFRVDGDELYDVKGLSVLREKILTGEYQKYWKLRGYFFHVISYQNGRAVGYMAPPSKDPNKLINFSLVKSWKPDGEHEMCMGGKIKFIGNKYSYKNPPPKKYLYKKSKWNECLMRCCHMRMVKRSSKDSNFDKGINIRVNLQDIHGKKNKNYRKKYQIGKRWNIDVSDFFKISKI